jgi:MoaA/NifB/PqqE/SkfB family radical SAM enzyme
MNTFCVLPWYSQEFYKNITPCCLLPNNYDLDLIKQDLLNSIQTPACNKCWKIEAMGQQSRRQQENIFLDYKLDQDIDLIRQDCKEQKHETLLYQITTSNLCNQACVSCDSQLSTKWAQVEQKMGKVPHPPQYFDHHNINYSKARKISLLGGEPLFDPRTFEILKKLIDHNNTDCFISLITNGSITLNDQQIELLKQFSDLNICISIDGIGPVFEYMRWPGKWDTLTANINQYCSITKDISVSYTISSLNALYYDQTVEWFKQNNLNYNHSIVSRPNWLSLENMPVRFKQHLIDKKNFVSKFCNISGDEISIDTIAYNIKQQDVAKNIKLQDYLPEIWQLLN